MKNALRNAYSARLIINIDEFHADSTEDAEKIINDLITKLAAASAEHSQSINWDEVDFDIIPENEVY
jgi:hypothetical protein